MFSLKSRSPFAVRKFSLASGASLLALCLAAPATAATVTISTATTAAVATGGSDLTVASGGSITLPSGTAITVNSDNAVSVASGGSVVIAQANNDVGVLITGARTATINLGGVITLSPPTDTTITDYADGGAGIRVASGSTLTATGGAANDAITTLSGSTINVTSDSGAGVDILGAVNGNINLGGAINLAGTNAAGVRIAAPVSGKVSIFNVATVGVGTSSVVIVSPIGGRLQINGSVTGTGFDKLSQDTTTGSTNYNAAQSVKIGGPTVAIGADVAGGVLANGPTLLEIQQVAAGTFPAAPFAAGTAQTAASSISAFGSKPAVLISPNATATPSNIHIGVVGSGDDAYGFINRGSISSSGIYNGVASEGVRIEGATISGTTYTTTLDGGFRNENTISTKSLEASTTAIAIGASANVPAFISTSGINALAQGSTSSSATGVLIEAGASVPSFVNSGTIESAFLGPTGSAYGIRDLSNTLATITNTGRIAGEVGPLTAGGTATGTTNAIDFTGSTINHLVTNDQTGTVVGASENFGRIIGNIRFGSGADTFVQNKGAVTGLIDFGAGNDTFNIAGGAVVGGATFGAGTDVFTMTGGSFLGTLTDTDGALTINDTNGALSVLNTGVINVTNATFSTGAVYTPDLDSVLNASTVLKASAGQIRFDTGSKISLQFNHLFNGDFSAPLAQASTLTIQPSLTDLLSTSVPFLYKVSLDRTVVGGLDSLNVHLVLKTPAELGLPANWTPALQPMLNALAHDDTLGIAFLGLSTQPEFANAFSQLLPFNTDASLETARESTLDHSRMMRDRSIDLISGNRTGGIWGEELIHSFNRKGSSSPLAYNGEGLMTGFGIDDYVDYNTIVGMSFALDHSTFDESRVSGSPVENSRYILGLYAGAGIGNLIMSTSATGAFTHNTSDRSIAIGAVTRNTSGKWNGSIFSGDISATYLGRLGGINMRPEGGFQFIQMSEAGYTEKGGADPLNAAANAVSLSVASRSQRAILSHLGLGFSLGDTTRHDESAANYNPRLAFVPEFKVGWVHDFTSDPTTTRAHFINETQWFTMKSDKRLQDLFTADLSIALVSDFGEVRLRLGGAFGSGATALTGGISVGASF